MARRIVSSTGTTGTIVGLALAIILLVFALNLLIDTLTAIWPWLLGITIFTVVLVVVWRHFRRW